MKQGKKKGRLFDSDNESDNETPQKAHFDKEDQNIETTQVPESLLD